MGRQMTGSTFEDINAGGLTGEFWKFVDRIRESGLPAHVRHTALEIWLHMRPDKMRSNPSVARLARNTGLSERTVQSDIKKLSEAGLFEVEFSKGGRAQSHSFIAKRIAETAQEIQGLLDNPEPAAGFAGETPHVLPRFDRGKPRTVCTVLDETPHVEAENPAPRAPEATREATLDSENISPPIVPPNGDEYRSVWIEDGIPAVANGKRAALEKLLGGKGLDLDTALVAVAARVEDGTAGEIWANLTVAIADYAAKGGKAPRRQAAKVPEKYTDDFEYFWKLYPRPVGKGVAFRSWQRLSMPQKRKAYAALVRQLADLKAKSRSPRGNICPHPSTWINQGRFDDEPEAETPNGKSDSYSFGKYVGATL